MVDAIQHSQTAAVRSDRTLMKSVDWYNNRRLLGTIRSIPRADAEEAFYANLNKLERNA